MRTTAGRALSEPTETLGVPQDRSSEATGEAHWTRGTAGGEESQMSRQASDTVTISRAELDALKAELRRLRRMVGRDSARARILADPGPSDRAPVLTREQLAEAWGITE